MDCVDMVAFTYDADCHLGFCGDVYGGQGILGPLGAAVVITFPRGVQRERVADDFGGMEEIPRRTGCGGHTLIK